MCPYHNVLPGENCFVFAYLHENYIVFNTIIVTARWVTKSNMRERFHASSSLGFLVTRVDAEQQQQQVHYV